MWGGHIASAAGGARAPSGGFPEVGVGIHAVLPCSCSSRLFSRFESVKSGISIALEQPTNSEQRYPRCSKYAVHKHGI